MGAKGERIKSRQFNFELPFNGLFCKGNVYLNAHSVLWGFMG